MLTLLLGGEFLADEGTPKYLHGSYQYTTERKRVETHLAAARDKAPEASAAKTAFLGAMSHELLTPLNAIIGFTDLILQETVGPISQPGYLEFARSVRTAGQRALAVFRDVLMMAELEADLFPLHLEEIDLCALAEAVVREFRRTSTAFPNSCMYGSRIGIDLILPSVDHRVAVEIIDELDDALFELVF